nr:transcription factor bHLH162-like isoform X2 [Ipomoea batatas]
MPTKLERKHVEKKRRDNLKFLYNHLFSLLPTHHISPGTMALPDQVDKAVNYIKTLQIQLEKSKQKKQELLLEHRILHQHGLEVSTAVFQPRGNSTLQILHQQGFGGTTAKTVYEKLKQAAVNGSSSSEPESLDSWDFDIWGFPVLETSQEQLHNPPPY